MRLGLIGPGKHGSRYLLPQNGGKRIYMVHSRSGREIEFPELPKSEHTTDADRFFSAGLDGIIIATPPDSHQALALRAIAAGIPVLCEKPLALTWEDCAAIIDAAEAAKVPLLVGHTHLFAELFEALMAEPRETTVIIGGPTGDHDYPPRIDWGSHAIAMWAALRGFRVDRTPGYILTSYRCLRVRAPGGETIYTGQEPSSQPPMARMLAVFEKLLLGGSDPRASYDFARDVYRVLLCPSP